MIQLLFLSIAAGRELSNTCETLWDQWKETLDKSYSEEEDSYRQQIFCANCHNTDHFNHEQGGDSHCETNPFADRTEEERSSYFGLSTYDPPMLRSFATMSLGSEFNNMPTTESFDWRNHENEDGPVDVVGPVENQGSCGSCWAFTISGACEGNLAIKVGRLSNLSEEWLKDCTMDSPWSAGCQGGQPEKILEYLITGESYIPVQGLDGVEPYEPVDPIEKPAMCSSDKVWTQAAQVKRYSEDIAILTARNEANMRKLMVQMGPVSVAIDAGEGNHLLDYTGGVISGDQCRFTRFNHAVLLVAFDATTYTFKNSWGVQWGENGFFRMVRDYNNPNGSSRGC
jgi:C1A family cysteine protease